jgi:protein-L-isoaspartate(D-aspartate) O-methyltransferase
MGEKRAFQRAAVAGLLVVVVAGTAAGQSRDRFRDARYEMVREYIEREGISNPRVLQAMRTVPRHEFVRTVDRSKAYLDLALPIGHQQTISPPFIVAYMTETLDPQPDDRVLEIGAGSGYQAAVLAELVREVYTIEIVEPLGKQAQRRLKGLGYDNVFVRIGDGYEGWEEHAPFDKIIVTCSPENVPGPLVEQLKDGGRMIIPLGERYQQVFHLFEKRDGKLVEQRLIPTLFVPMTGVSEELREVKPDPLKPRIVNGGFEIDSTGDGQPDNWHYRRMTTLVTGDAPEGERYVVFENSEPGRQGQMLQGMALDGSRIGALRISLMVKRENVAAGRESWEQPGLAVHFFDAQRRYLPNVGSMGPWTGRSDWQRQTAEIKVPPNAREAAIRVGLNGGTGRLSIDDVRLTPVPR